MIPSRKIARSTHTHRNSAPQNKMQVAVLGSPRGGTSMIAGILSQLGLHMGTHIDPDNLEDQEFLTHKGDREIFQNPLKAGLLDGYINHTKSLIQERNKNFDKWGWKDPLSVHYIRQLTNECPNLRIIAVFRDPIAIAQREFLEIDAKGSKITPQTFVDDAMVALDHLQAIVQFARDSQMPFMFISYERAIRQPKDLISEIAAFCGFSAVDERMREISTYVQADRLTGAVSPVGIIPMHSRGFGVHKDNRLAELVSNIIEDGKQVTPEKGVSNFTIQKHAPKEVYAIAVQLLDKQDFAAAEATSVRLVSSLVEMPFDARQTLEAMDAAFLDIDLTHFSPEHRDITAGALYVAGMAGLLAGDYMSASSYLKRAASLTQHCVTSEGETAEISPAIAASSLFHWALAERFSGNISSSKQVRHKLGMFALYHQKLGLSKGLAATISFERRAETEL